MSENTGKSGRQDSSLSARRARLRALAQQPGSYNNSTSNAAPAEPKKSEGAFQFYPEDADKSKSQKDSQEDSKSAAEPIIDEVPAVEEAKIEEQKTSIPPSSSTQAPKDSQLPQKQDDQNLTAASGSSGVEPQANALVLLGSIESSLNVCAMNLSQLVKAASDQGEALTNLRDLIQNQTFFEIGLNLNTLLDSLSAALEPMKAVGELVPSIDQLVTTIETRGGVDSDSMVSRASPDQLLMSLSNQLANGEIDPWTFKSAYMAIYPDDHPADLLHRLVELLGTQRLSGTLFRAAYDAVQVAEPPPRSGTGYGSDEISGNDRELLNRIEELTETNRELQTLLDGRSVDVSRKVEEVEEEYAEILASKEQELQEMQDTLSLRIEEFNARFEELESLAKSSKDALQSKDEEVKSKEEELKKKEDDITQKSTEVSQLRQQLSELQDTFRDTVSDLQKQLTSVKQASADMARQVSQPAASVAVQPQVQPAPQPQPHLQQPQLQQPQLQQPIQPVIAQPVQQVMSQPEPIKPKPQPSSGGFFDSSQEMRQAAQQNQLNQQMDTFNSMSRIPASEPSYQQNASRSGAAYGGAPPTTPLPAGGGQGMAGGGGAGGGNIPPGMGGGSYGNGVRAQVFEVIVRQALAGAPWREICAGPMQVNNISSDEVEAEVQKRQAMLRQ